MSDHQVIRGSSHSAWMSEYCSAYRHAHFSSQKFTRLGFRLILKTKKNDHRAVHGGDWVDGARLVRVAYRYIRHPDLRYSRLGFRLILKDPK